MTMIILKPLAVSKAAKAKGHFFFFFMRVYYPSPPLPLSPLQLNRGLPSSVSLQPGQGEADKPCGVDFILRCFIGKLPEDKIEKRSATNTTQLC